MEDVSTKLNNDLITSYIHTQMFQNVLLRLSHIYISIRGHISWFSSKMAAAVKISQKMAASFEDVHSFSLTMHRTEIESNSQVFLNETFCTIVDMQKSR